MKRLLPLLFLCLIQAECERYKTEFECQKECKSPGRCMPMPDDNGYYCGPPKRKFDIIIP